MKTRQVGIITAEVISLLELSIEPGMPILLGESNYKHMQESHPEAFADYFEYLEDILAKPDFVNLNPKDGSVKYIKHIFGNVAVGERVSASGTAFARTIFIVETWKLRQYEAGGYLKQCSK